MNAEASPALKYIYITKCCHFDDHMPPSRKASGSRRTAPFLTVLLLPFLLSTLQAESREELRMSLGTEIWPYYEMLDRQPTGPDAAGSTEESTGFSMGRARLNVVGRHYSDGEEGIGFRFTVDQELNPPDACQGYSCSDRNPYIAKMKFAFVDYPLTDWLSVRAGQQHTPVVDGQAGVSLQDLWAHRYIARAPWDDFGASPSTDRGISAILSFEYVSMQFLLSNGEGISSTNAQARLNGFTTPEDVLQSMSEGMNSNYGLAFTGMITFSPLGQKGNHRIHINLPFRFENVAGLSGQDTRLPALDACNDSITMVASGPSPDTGCTNILSTLSPSLYVGQTRAARDYAAGLELTHVFMGQGTESTLGLGYIQKVDRRGTAYRIRTATPASTFSDLSRNYLEAEDRSGDMVYIYWHGRYQQLGAFLRFGTGTGNGTTSNNLGTSDDREYWRQIVSLDAKDNTIGNLSYAEAQSVDFGKARFREWIAGITLYAHPSFRISAGWSLTTATNASGSPAKVSTLDNYNLPGGTSLSETLGDADTYAQIPDFYNALGRNRSEGFRIQDYAGSRARNEQIFIRATFEMNGEFSI